MAHDTAYFLAVVSIVLALVSIFILPGLLLLIAFILLALAVMMIASEVEVKRVAPVPEPPRGMRYACPGCGADVYAGQAVCPECGAALPAANAPVGPGATPP